MFVLHVNNIGIPINSELLGDIGEVKLHMNPFELVIKCHIRYFSSVQLFFNGGPEFCKLFVEEGGGGA